jgi:hypothetical protein
VITPQKPDNAINRVSEAALLGYIFACAGWRVEVAGKEERSEA